MAVAHGGADGHSGFVAGFLHPLGGADHLLAMLAAGFWAVQLGGRAIWLLPSVFVAAMSLGGMAGLAGMDLPLMEVAIFFSAPVFGAMIALGYRLSLSVAISLVGFFALFHGWAHGAEIPQAADAAGYDFGFVLATLALNACGLLLGLLVRGTRCLYAQRYAGGAIICVAFLFSAVH
ncbi:HupE/UreJ family protein [Microbulbifer sp. TB1203]|uniref:HupE/UreJ family protein n=1 Tax=Microbulbifer sp. TB1203 TaxID=3021712 RepID=UPI0027E3D7B4|nr:HupE/UreJ family protein [Microbulbifer sp. TB1203]